MNSNLEILEQILRVDIEAGEATSAQRKAQAELHSLADKVRSSEELLAKTHTDMAFLESEMRRQYRRIDELEERRNERSAKLFAARSDDEHRATKREIDHLDREVREVAKKCEDLESRIEFLKEILRRTEVELVEHKAATADERARAEGDEIKSANHLKDLDQVRENLVTRLDERVSQHYRRVFHISRNPSGPVTRIENGACGNCHMGLPPNLLNAVIRARDVEFCPSCYHILLPKTN